MDKCDAKGLIGENEVKELITDLFGNHLSRIESTDFKDHVDLKWTAVTSCDEVYYTAEVKKRGASYPFSAFTGDGRFASEGVYIKDKKIKALMEGRIGENGEPRKCFYITTFPENYVCIWEINEKTKYYKVEPKCYNRCNEYPEKGKVMQYDNKGLLPKDAIVYHDRKRVS